MPAEDSEPDSRSPSRSPIEPRKSPRPPSPPRQSRINWLLPARPMNRSWSRNRLPRQSRSPIEPGRSPRPPSPPRQSRINWLPPPPADEPEPEPVGSLPEDPFEREYAPGGRGRGRGGRRRHRLRWRARLLGPEARRQPSRPDHRRAGGAVADRRHPGPGRHRDRAAGADLQLAEWPGRQSSRPAPQRAAAPASQRVDPSSQPSGSGDASPSASGDETPRRRPASRRRPSGRWR